LRRDPRSNAEVARTLRLRRIDREGILGWRVVVPRHQRINRARAGCRWFDVPVTLRATDSVDLHLLQDDLMADGGIGQV